MPPNRQDMMPTCCVCFPVSRLARSILTAQCHRDWKYMAYLWGQNLQIETGKSQIMGKPGNPWPQCKLAYHNSVSALFFPETTQCGVLTKVRNTCLDPPVGRRVEMIVARQSLAFTLHLCLGHNLSNLSADQGLSAIPLQTMETWLPPMVIGLKATVTSLRLSSPCCHKKRGSGYCKLHIFSRVRRPKRLSLRESPPRS